MKTERPRGMKKRRRLKGAAESEESRGAIRDERGKQERNSSPNDV